MAREDSPPYTILDSQFEDFKRYCKDYVDFFGLYDWEIEYTQDDLEGALAECYTSQQDKVCVIVLGKTWVKTKPSPDNLLRTAFHEVWELLTSELEVVARNDYELSREQKQKVLERARHTLIRRMENCVLPHLPIDI